MGRSAVSVWNPMQRANPIPLHAKRRRDMMAWAIRQGANEEEAEQIIADAEGAETWMNQKYVATVRRDPTIGAEGWPPMAHLAIRRVDRKVIHDWRDLQRVKADIFGATAEAVELYPADDRVVDTANSYHLWVFTDGTSRFPVGWEYGLKTDDTAIEGQQRQGSEDT